MSPFPGPRTFSLTGVMMHPELIRALGRERHAELLRRQQFRNTDDFDAWPGPRSPGSVRHLRRTLGSALVTAGTRLMAAPGPRDWAVPLSGDRASHRA